MAREAKRANRLTPSGKLIYLPEDRMRENAWLGAVLMPAALLWYGWTVDKGVFWFCPIFANFFFGYVFARVVDPLLLLWLLAHLANHVVELEVCNTGRIANVPARYFV